MAMHTLIGQATLADARALVELPEGTPVEVIGLLLVKGERALAVDLLFCATQEEMYGAKKWPLYSKLITGRYDDLILEMAVNHSWSKEPTETGYCVEIYRGEYFVLVEPLASQVTALLGNGAQRQ